ncbi:hypothetical protein ACRALDRAFT_208224 [Sodiomyces alcalophilus JCM 7366]|uniref:uncharacterized protein n=1 Tax=Sodiomyces alcalophilus JCM 7366 TaxID=591952 RepID=UPI0039B6400D
MDQVISLDCPPIVNTRNGERSKGKKQYCNFTLVERSSKGPRALKFTTSYRGNATTKHLYYQTHPVHLVVVEAKITSELPTTLGVFRSLRRMRTGYQ